MKCLVCYFSATSNTKKVVDVIMDEVKDVYSEIDVINIATYLTCQIELKANMFYDLLILSFPVHSQRMPKEFMGFMKSQNIKCTKAILISTYGGVTIGNALYQASNMLFKKGILTYGAICLQTRHSYSLAYKNIDTIDFFDEHTKESLSVFSQNCFVNILEQSPVKIPKKSSIKFMLPQPFLSKLTLKLPVVDINKCVRCNKCIESCPVNAISNNLKIDKSKCIRCCACVYACDYQARECVIKNSISKMYIGSRIQKQKTPYIIV